MSRDSRLLRYRWVVLFALASWILLALTIVLGLARREGMTVKHSFIPLAMLLVSLAPVSVRRIVTHRWFVPIAAAWSCSAIVSIHYVGAWLTGFGHQCDGIVWTATTTAFSLLNIGWLASKLWCRATAERRQAASPIQTSATV